VPLRPPASVIFEYLCDFVCFSRANKYSQSVSRDDETRHRRTTVDLFTSVLTAARPEYHVGGGVEPGAWRARERQPITGVWGRSPQRGPGTEPQSGG